MKILIIDSHKGSKESIPQNLHWQNSKILADHLGADLIWSYPTVNTEIKGGYDVIIFVHASPYAYTDYEWLQKSPDAKLYLITNEYNLGEPRTLWMAAKEGRKYTVIANHPHEPSKIVMKYVNDWVIVNLNALIFNPVDKPSSVIIDGATGNKQLSLFEQEQATSCIYYGSFRKDRSEYFAKYLTKDVTLSTHPKNIDKFRMVGANSPTIPRISWHPKGTGIWGFKTSLYLEDKKTHTYYNYLANRFYEALNYGVTPIFTVECMNTLKKCEYTIPANYIINNPTWVKYSQHLEIPKEWYKIAEEERHNTITEINNLIYENKISNSAQLQERCVLCPV